MKTEDFSFDLPEELIAQAPEATGRDQARLMVLSRAHKTIGHQTFAALPSLLQPGDVVVLNDSKVIPARLPGKKTGTGGRLECLLLHQRTDGKWVTLLGGSHIKVGLIFSCGVSHERELIGTVVGHETPETWIVEFSLQNTDFDEALNFLGRTPIPPYIKQTPLHEDQLRQEYQTIYAQTPGSVAAPTAGLHFTHELLDGLRAHGVELHTITLHVSLGTFAPVKVDDVANHRMHSEFASLSPETAMAINAAKKEGRRIIAVGTTTVRTLETFMRDGKLKPGEQWTDIFITPGYTFQCVDSLITNFHLPRSTLLMLVSAFAGHESIFQAYQEAINQRYRFYSFGDAMLIL